MPASAPVFAFPEPSAGPVAIDWGQAEDGFAAKIEEALLDKGFSLAASDAVVAAVMPAVRDECLKQAGEALGALLRPLRDSRAGVTMLHALKLDLGFSSLEEAGRHFGASPQAIEQTATRVRRAFTGLPAEARKPRKSREQAPPDASGQWLDRTATALRLGVSLATLARYQREGLLAAAEGKAGGTFFDVREVDRVIAKLAQNSAKQLLKELRDRASAPKKMRVDA